MSPSSNIASPSKERSTSSKSALSCLCLGTRKRCSAMMPPTSLRTRGMRAEHRFLTLQGSYNRASHRRWSDQLKVPRKSNPSSTIAFSSSASTSPPESETRSCITASRSITTPRFSALRTLAKAPSTVRLRVRCDLAAIPVLSFSGERVGEVPLDLKSAPSEIALAVVHRGLVAEQQNQRRGIASILTTADLGYSTALQGATIRSQPLFTRLAQSKLLYRCPTAASSHRDIVEESLRFSSSRLRLLPGYIDGCLGCPPAMIRVPGEPSLVPNSAHKLWLRQDRLILQAIKASVAGSIAPLLSSCVTAAEA
ncbi:hypothetical protein GW17_00061157, partial [Ensete ventricosum]